MSQRCSCTHVCLLCLLLSCVRVALRQARSRPAKVKLEKVIICFLLVFRANTYTQQGGMATSPSGHFPLTVPIPSVLTTPDLVPLTELALELDLIRSGASNFTRWIHYINNVEASVLQAELDARGTASDEEAALLGAKLSTAAGRKGLQRLTDLYERALALFPTSYKLWKQYLDMRSSYVLGKPKRKVNLKAPKKKRGNAEDADEVGGTELILKYLNEGVKDPETGETGEALTENERDVDAQWEGGLDGVVGAEEWRSLAGTFERALMWLPRVCSSYQMALQRTPAAYLCKLYHFRCPEYGSTTSTSSSTLPALLS